MKITYLLINKIPLNGKVEGRNEEFHTIDTVSARKHYDHTKRKNWLNTGHQGSTFTIALFHT